MGGPEHKKKKEPRPLRTFVLLALLQSEPLHRANGPTCMRHICLKHTTSCLKYHSTRYLPPLGTYPQWYLGVGRYLPPLGEVRKHKKPQKTQLRARYAPNRGGKTKNTVFLLVTCGLTCYYPRLGLALASSSALSFFLRSGVWAVRT